MSNPSTGPKRPGYDKDGKPFHPGIQYYVGGNTKVYGAALLRFRKEDFGEVMHHGGISPAWPLRYEDFEPYYTKAEHLYHVHGQRGVDPTEGPASAPYRYPPVSHEPRIQELFDDFQRLGHHPFPLPLGILLDEADGKALHTSACVRCPAFDGFPCLVNGKADAQVICVDPALEHSNVELLTGAYVERLETNPSGRVVTKVIVTRKGAVEEYSADIVVVACGAINSAALLLRSANEKHPGGLANSSDVVGRHYMRHNCSAFMAISKDPNPTVFQKTLALNDFYFRSEDWDYPLGEIQMLGKSDGEMLKGEAPGWAVWKPEFALDFLAEHSIDFWLQSEDLPDPDNRVTINAGWTDRAEHPGDQPGRTQRLTAKLKAMLAEIGCHDQLMHRSLYLGKNIPIGGTAHQAGTVRFGRDPKTSALDVNCKAHDLDNLYVVDASFFVSIAAVNPSLTIMANALRVGDHLLERLGSRKTVVEGGKLLKAIAIVPGTAGSRLVERPEPSIATPDEVKIRMIRVGICGTDREEVSGGRAQAPDGQTELVIGHEMFGQVVSVGSSVTRVKPGDYAVFTVRRGCGECAACLMNRADMCQTGKYRERGIRGLDGYQTEYAVDQEQYVVRVPAELEPVGVLMEPLSVVEKAIDESLRVQTVRCPDAATTPDWFHGRRCLVAGLGTGGPAGGHGLALAGRRGLRAGRGRCEHRPSEMVGWHRRALCRRPSKCRRTRWRRRSAAWTLSWTPAGLPSWSSIFWTRWRLNGIYVLTGIPGGDRPLQIPGAELIRQLVLDNQVMLGSVNAARGHFQMAADDLAQAHLRWGAQIASLITHRYSSESICRTDGSASIRRN